jgi:branched-chain amino acid transport system ATP-binding protein
VRTLLQVSELTAGYGALPVLDRVDLDVADGEAVALIGPNGAGKTTLLRTLAGLHRPTGGTIVFAGSSIAGRSASAIARAGLRLVPSDRRLFPGMSVRDNLFLGAHPRRADRDDLRHVTELFPRLAERWGQRAGTLSGGEQQMVAVGRALVGRPTLLVLDEPTTGLAPRLAAELYGALERLREERSITILVAEQQLPRVLDLADRGLVLDHGRVGRRGSAAALREDPEVRRAYLGVG